MHGSISHSFVQVVCTLQHTGLGYVHAVCGINQINHTSSEDMHPEYPPCMNAFLSLGCTSRKNTSTEDILWVHILLYTYNIMSTCSADSLPLL